MWDDVGGGEHPSSTGGDETANPPVRVDLLLDFDEVSLLESELVVVVVGVGGIVRE